MTHVKICGITNLDDALAAADAGADLLGFVFYAQSPRCIDPNSARAITDALRGQSKTPRLVGVFVNEAADRIREIIQLARLDLVQLHGDESEETIRALSPYAYKALRPRNQFPLERQLELFRPAGGQTKMSPTFIVDAFDPTHYGGTGVRADWSAAALIADEFPILLAGGLNTENVVEAIRIVRPWGVDVSSGVERRPGLKDHMQVRNFIQAAKGIT